MVIYLQVDLEISIIYLIRTIIVRDVRASDNIISRFQGHK
jgi:hypothetical protein